MATQQLQRLLRLSFAAAIFSAIGLISSTGWCYPWMMRYGATQCARCHADPSGSGVLTKYGRYVGDTDLRSHFGDDSGGKGDTKKFAFGVIPQPKGFLFGGSLRAASFFRKSEGKKASHRFVLMQANLAAQFKHKRFRIHADVGALPSGAQSAAIIPDRPLPIITREHWVGFDIGAHKEVLLRAGRINMPYGIRGQEHVFWARSVTRTDINVAQQHGLALAYHKGKWRAEVLGILGNYQISPDLYRERGYSLYIERSLSKDVALGVSSLVTAADGDISRSLRRPLTRHAHGLFARANLHKKFWLSAQADLLLFRTKTPAGAEDNRTGYVGFIQGDWEPWGGLHIQPAFEWRQRNTSFTIPAIPATPGSAGTPAQTFEELTAYGFMGSVVWFVLPHVDVRVDALYRRLPARDERVGASGLLLQLHAYL